MTVIADSLMDKAGLLLSPYLSASLTSAIPVAILRGGAKLYGESSLYGGKVNALYDFIRAKFLDFVEAVPFIFLGTAASGKLFSSLSMFSPVLFPLQTSCICVFHWPWDSQI